MFEKNLYSYIKEAFRKRVRHLDKNLCDANRDRGVVKSRARARPFGTFVHNLEGTQLYVRKPCRERLRARIGPLSAG